MKIILIQIRLMFCINSKLSLDAISEPKQSLQSNIIDLLRNEYPSEILDIMTYTINQEKKNFLKMLAL